MSADPPDLDFSDQLVEASKTIFISDPSAEADRLSTALRSRGYTVIDVPLSLLMARVAVQMPSLILLDVDTDGAFDVAARVGELPGAQEIDILFVGNESKTIAGNTDAAQYAAAGFLERPVDVQALLRKVDSLVGARMKEPPSVRHGPMSRIGQQTPASNRGPRSPIPEAWSDRPGPLPGNEDPLAGAFGPGAGAASKLPLPALSPEIEMLLQGAEERSAEIGPSSSLSPPPIVEPPSPDEELDSVLPAEVLAALDEPLDENDEDLESDAGLSTGPPRRATTSSHQDVATASGTGIGTQVGGPATRPPTLSRAPATVPPDPTDPKALETPRPPRRSPVSSPPPQIPKAPPAPVARESRPLFPLPPRVPPSAVAPTVPPGPISRTGATSSPPHSARTSAAQLIESAASDPRAARGTLPPRPPSAAPITVPMPGAASGELPTTPRSLGPGRRPSTNPPPPLSTGQETTPPSFQLPEELVPGDTLAAFAVCVRERATGALVIDSPEGVRRILLRDGDVVTAASGLDEESLVAFLGTRGDLPREIAAQLHGKIPAFGRHAGAALVANGHIGQDQLWPVLRAHAEWVLGCAIVAEKGAATFEINPPGRLKAEPSVFGGATGSEVLIEVVRRAVPSDAALARLGGRVARLSEGQRFDLLSECALSEPEQQWLSRSKGANLSEALSVAPHGDLAPVVFALVQLGVMSVRTTEGALRKKRANSAEPPFDPLDVQALRSQVKARLALVEEGDYFSLLGVPRTATGYEIHRAYLELRRGLEPSRVLSPTTSDLTDDLNLIIEVLEEAHEVLRDQNRRDRYRRAIEEKPPA